jgi:Fe2+ or Zn2+ uptake regulation protein
MTQNIPVKTQETIVDFLRTHRTTTAHNQVLEQLLNLGQRQVKRYLDILVEDKVLHATKEGKRSVYTLITKESVSVHLTKKDMQFFPQLFDLNFNEFDEKSLDRINQMFVAASEILLGRLPITEDLQDERFKTIYTAFKSAIKNHSYMRIWLSDEGLLDEVKPIRIVFIDNNWNLAFQTKDPKNGEKIFRFCRFSFIDKWEFIIKGKTRASFHVKEIQSYEAFLGTVQNGLSLYGVPAQTATIRATPAVAKYFDHGMKKFLPSQNFLSKKADGSVIFTLDYTQPLEIFILIRRWLPELIILEPASLIEAYCADLRETIARHDTIRHDKTLE